MTRLNKVHLWFIFAVQMHLDINHIPRNQVSRAFDELRANAEFLGKCLGHAIGVERNSKSKQELEKHMNDLRQVVKELNYFTKEDRIATLRVRNNLSKTEPFGLIKKHPVWCGLLSYTYHIWVQHAGLQFSNTTVQY